MRSPTRHREEREERERDRERRRKLSADVSRPIFGSPKSFFSCERPKGERRIHQPSAAAAADAGLCWSGLCVAYFFLPSLTVIEGKKHFSPFCFPQQFSLPPSLPRRSENVKLLLLRLSLSPLLPLCSSFRFPICLPSRKNWTKEERNLSLLFAIAEIDSSGIRAGYNNRQGMNG